MAFDSPGFDGNSWSGPSGQQIGFAGEYPITTGQGFTSDPIHSLNDDPNAPNTNALPGPSGVEIPVQIQEDPNSVGYQYDGSDGWLIDDIPLPSFSEAPGTAGHEMPYQPAQRRGRDAAHELDVYQHIPPQGFGQSYWGIIRQDDLAAWKSSSTPAPNTGQFPAEAREVTSDWPEPFAVQTVAHHAPVVVDMERIPMRRLAEDDRPVYQYQAVPARNILPSGSVYNPSYPSNQTLRNVTPTPQMQRVPEDPWVSLQSQDPTDYGVDVGDWQ